MAEGETTQADEGAQDHRPGEPEGGKDGEDANSDSSRAQPVDVHPPTVPERFVYGSIRGVLRGMAAVWLRLDIVGRDHIPAEGPFVLAPVHRSNLDFLMAAFATKRRMRYMGKASLWKIKPIGRLFNMLGAFPVHRGTADRASLRTCLQIIDNGEPLVMFPEGTRRSGAQVAEVFDGPAYVAARGRVPIVPVGIAGSDKAMPIGAKVIYPRKVKIVIGEPIAPPGEDGRRVPRRAVREATDKLRDEVQAVYDEAQRLLG